MQRKEIKDVPQQVFREHRSPFLSVIESARQATTCKDFNEIHKAKLKNELKLLQDINSEFDAKKIHAYALQSKENAEFIIRYHSHDSGPAPLLRAKLPTGLWDDIKAAFPDLEDLLKSRFLISTKYPFGRGCP